jgi:co-chaperonin GroES (HSP10)
MSDEKKAPLLDESWERDEDLPIIPVGDRVLLALEKAPSKITKSGIIVPDADSPAGPEVQQQKQKYIAKVAAVGPEARGYYKIGDYVAFNNYDAMKMERYGKLYVLARDVSIWAVIPNADKPENISAYTATDE